MSALCTFGSAMPLLLHCHVATHNGDWDLLGVMGPQAPAKPGSTARCYISQASYNPKDRDFSGLAAELHFYAIAWRQLCFGTQISPDPGSGRRWTAAKSSSLAPMLAVERRCLVTLLIFNPLFHLVIHFSFYVWSFPSLSYSDLRVSLCICCE